MSALDDLLNKPKLTRSQLEWAILVTLEHGGEATAMSAAEELAALRRVAEAARALIHAEDDNAINHKYSVLVSTVYEYDKCRAA